MEEKNVYDQTVVLHDEPVPYGSFKHALLLGEADFSFSRAFAQEFSKENNVASTDKAVISSRATRKQITATEYGDGEDIAIRYFDGDNNCLSKAMNSLLDLDSIKEVICSLNARHLGTLNERGNKRHEDGEKENHGCTCQRWNANLNGWDDESPFWKNDGDQIDLIIFNFPHSDQAGRATKLVKALFKQLRICIDNGKVANHAVLEMRLRTIEKNPEQKRNIRSSYNHDESAKESGFTCIGCWPSDLNRWEALGYRHKMTKKNETCLDISLDCKVWRWKSL